MRSASQLVSYIVAVVSLLASAYSWGAEKESKPPHLVVADPSIQSQIQRAVQALQKNERNDDPTIVCRALSPLIELAHENAPKLVQQLIYHHSAAKDVTDGMMLFIVIHYARISKLSMVEAIAPLLGTDDPKLQNGVREVCGIIETPAVRGIPNYEYYKSYLRVKHKTGDKIEQGLIEHMYQVSPGESLLTLTHVFIPSRKQRPILWAEHIVADALWKHNYEYVGKKETEADAANQLDKLSKSPHWWARLYVAEIMRKHKGFRQPEIIERLKQDKHPLVRKTIAAFTKKADPSGDSHER